jgi:ABC-type multidrug transport system fused ATPase/permease subunit
MPANFAFEDKRKVSTLIKKLRPKSLTNLVIELVSPYKFWLAIIFMAMMLETAMSLLAPWPLKIIIDNVIIAKP